MAVWISDAQVPNLARYKYKGEDKSLVSRYVLTPYWRSLVQMLPMWMAPNLVTLIGFAPIIFNVITMFWYAPDLESACPGWVYMTWGLGLFMYQSFDAIDGMQARRTGTSSPLGQVFDHGVDALNTTLGALLASAALGVGRNRTMLLVQFATLANFYLTTWEEYHTHRLFLSYFSGPIEGILIIVGLFFATAMLGPEFWQSSIFPATEYTPTLTLKLIFIIFCGLGLLANIVVSSSNVRTYYKLQGKKYSHAFLDLMPFVVFWIGLFAWTFYVPSLVDHLLIPLIFFSGIVFALNVGLVIIAHVTQSRFPHWIWLYALVPLGMLVGQEFATEYIYAALGISIGVYICFVNEVIVVICNFFDINCLTIKQKPLRSSPRKRSK